MANVQLIAESQSPFQSLINITVESGEVIHQFNLNGKGDIYIGSLDELRDAAMTVNTFLPPDGSVSYKIKYDDTEVESRNVLATSLFTFKFCPRFPFC